MFMMGFNKHTLLFSYLSFDFLHYKILHYRHSRDQKNVQKKKKKRFPVISVLCYCSETNYLGSTCKQYKDLPQEITINWLLFQAYDSYVEITG